jgi:hypothetical protein
MKALTLTHPWPWAMVELPEAAAKRVENRSWEPPRKLIGQHIALHGGRLPSGAKLAEVRADALYIENEILEDGIGDPALTAEDLSDDDVRDLCLPGLFAVARLAEVVTHSDSPWFFGPFGWVLDEVTRIDPPVPHTGAQGLWEVSPAALAQLRARYRQARSPAVTQCERAPALPAEVQPPRVSQPRLTCAGCDHALPYNPVLIECGLGWEPHDRLGSRPRPSSERIVYTAPHGELEKPLLTPTHGCVAVIGGRPAYVPRRVP